MTNLTGEQLQDKIKEIQNKYNLYKISLDQAKEQIQQIIDIINERAYRVAKKHDKTPHFLEVSYFLN
jgi:hypothetical protein